MRNHEDETMEQILLWAVGFPVPILAVLFLLHFM
jgi:hypothetical protein